MTATLTAIAKKLAVMLATDKRAWKAVGMILAMIIVIALLPVMFLLSMGNGLQNSNDLNLNVAEYMQNLSPEQQVVFEQIEFDGQSIIDELTKQNSQQIIVKAQVIYLTYFENVPKEQYFFAEYCSFFMQATDDEQLINHLNERYDLQINYYEFMRSYSVIRNVSIDKYQFVNTDIMNNIDLKNWAENAYESQWGCVPNTFGNVLYENEYFGLKEQYSDKINDDCDKWISRRTADNQGLLYSYLWYDFNVKEFAVGEQISAQEMLNLATTKGKIDTLPETVGIVVFDGESIGICVGNGEVVYAKSIADGVVKEKIAVGGWTHWFEVSDISYGEESDFNNEIQFADCYDPNVKNNLDLVQWAIQANGNGWGYVYGTYGNVLTESILQDRANIFGNQVTNYSDFIRQNWLGKRTADCIGLIKGYGWFDNTSGEVIVGSNGMMDVTANGMFEVASLKGTIDTIPEVPGIAVWHDGHIGVYIGNGEVIEAMNTMRGVTKTPISYGNWTHWLQIPYINYIEEKKEE